MAWATAAAHAAWTHGLPAWDRMAGTTQACGPGERPFHDLVLQHRRPAAGPPPALVRRPGLTRLRSTPGSLFVRRRNPLRWARRQEGPAPLPSLSGATWSSPPSASALRSAALPAPPPRTAACALLSPAPGKGATVPSSQATPHSLHTGSILPKVHCSFNVRVHPVPPFSALRTASCQMARLLAVQQQHLAQLRQPRSQRCGAVPGQA